MRLKSVPLGSVKLVPAENATMFVMLGVPALNVAIQAYRERLTQTIVVTFNVPAMRVAIQSVSFLRFEMHDGLRDGLLRRCVAHSFHSELRDAPEERPVLLNETCPCRERDHVRDVQRAHHVRGVPGLFVSVCFETHNKHRYGLMRRSIFGASRSRSLFVETYGIELGSLLADEHRVRSHRI